MSFPESKKGEKTKKRNLAILDPFLSGTVTLQSELLVDKRYRLDNLLRNE